MVLKKQLADLALFCHPAFPLPATHSCVNLGVVWVCFVGTGWEPERNNENKQKMMKQNKSR